MGFLDKAKKLAEQAKGIAEQAKGMAEDALGEARARSASTESGAAPAAGHDPRMGTPYVPGSLGRPGWRERGLVDPAAILPIDDRDRFGVPRSTRSEVLEEAYGMGRRWSAAGRSVGLFYRLYPEHQGFDPPGGTSPFPEVGDARLGALPDGRSLVFIDHSDRHVVLELDGLGDDARVALSRRVVEQLESN